MLVLVLAPNSVDAALPFLCHYGKQDLSCHWMPTKNWKSWLKLGGYADNDPDVLIVGIWDTISRIKMMFKQRKLPERAEPESDEAAVGLVNKILGQDLEREPRRSRAAVEVLGNEIVGNSSRSCEICSKVGNTLEMLICDNCEKAFHVSCCKPKTKKMPTEGDDWFCQRCSKGTHKVSPESSFLQSPGIRLSNRTSKSGSDLIKSMLLHPEQHTSRVKIDEFHQVEVPDWSAQRSQVFDMIDEPKEMNLAETFNSLGCPTGKQKNWLQCLGEGLLSGDAGESGRPGCGKWRRAPFSEVQTDDWDCSCCVLWDRARADCAVPQELETDHVLKELKQLERLRSRLSARERR